MSIKVTASSPTLIKIREPNDALEFAIDIQLGEQYPNFSISSSIDYKGANRYVNEDGTFKLIDATEDVDLYKVNLKAGDTIKVDVDSCQLAAGQLATRLITYTVELSGKVSGSVVNNQ